MKSESRLSGERLVSILFTCLILTGAFAVLRPFLLAIIWAAIIAIASWPLYLAIEARCAGRRGIASVLTTALIYLVQVDASGARAREWLGRVPWLGHYLLERWNLYLAEPNQLSTILRSTL